MTARPADPFAGWPPERTIFPIEGVDLCVLPGDHPFHAREGQASATNWIREQAAKPALFDGQVVFFDRMVLDGGTIRAEGHLTPFSTFLWWRRQPLRTGGAHLFSWAIPVSSDGAVIAIRMGEHTANAGMVYCAAGSLDANDIVDGKCDIDGNMIREVAEETGLDLGAARPDPGLLALRDNGCIVVFRTYRFALTAQEMLARIEEHMRDDEEQEIAGAIAIRSADPDAHAYSRFMLPILERFFNGAAAG